MRQPFAHRRAVISAVLSIASLAAAAGASGALASRPGALADLDKSRPAATSSASPTIHPGVNAKIKSVSCEVSLLLREGHSVYAAFPASCIGTDEGMQTPDDCQEAQFPPGTHVHIVGARHLAKVAYSSFTEMVLRGTRSKNACSGNNLALARLNPADAKRATPAIPAVGRPHDAMSAAPADGAPLVAYISGRTTATAGTTMSGGWQQTIKTSRTSTDENLGAPVVSNSGKLVGFMSELPTMTSLNAFTVGNLARELRFLRRTAGFHHVTLLSHRLK